MTFIQFNPELLTTKRAEIAAFVAGFVDAQSFEYMGATVTRNVVTGVSIKPDGTAYTSLTGGDLSALQTLLGATS